MKINHKPLSDENDKNIISKFLWFPKRIGYQTRWLEWVTWKREYKYYWWCDSGKWVDLDWVDDPQWDER